MRPDWGNPGMCHNQEIELAPSGLWNNAPTNQATLARDVLSFINNGVSCVGPFLTHLYISPDPWKTEVFMKHSMNDHQCYVLLKELGPIYKPQEAVLAQDTI